MSKSVAKRKPRKRCDNCSKINPPDAKNCLNCKRVFISSAKHSTLLTSEESLENTDLFFNETEINLLISLGNLSGSDDNKVTKPAAKPAVTNKVDVWGNRSMPMTRIPLVIHDKKELKSKRKYIQVIIGLILTIFVILLCLYLLK